MKKTKPSDWLFFVDSDITMAQRALSEKIYHIACFHAQQAAEKLLKAVLADRNKLIPKDHSLRGNLYAAVHSSIPEIDQHIEILNSLDRFYLATRYPDALPGSLPDGLPIREDAEKAISDVQELYTFIRMHISE